MRSSCAPAGGLLYVHADRLGSVVALSDRKGEVVARYAYEAFGQPWAGVFEPYNRYGFTGKPYDEKTGLSYYGARWYDPAVGRWLSQDPIRDGLNWYAYCNNNPVNWVDPWGLRPEQFITGQEIDPILRAESLIGTPYGHAYPGERAGSVIVAEAPAQIDCTELISYAYQTTLCRTWEFEENPSFIRVEIPQRGDVVITIANTEEGETEGHAAIYTGESGTRSLIQSDPVGGVRYTSDYVKSYYTRQGYNSIQRTYYRKR